MSYSDLFSSGFTSRNQDHFASIVSVALSDGVISPEEQTFLDRLSQKLDISKERYSTILDNYKSHPINPPASLEKRIERLYDLARMVYADKLKNIYEVTLLTKLVIGLGFPLEIASKVVSTSLKLVSDRVDIDTFKKEMNAIL